LPISFSFSVVSLRAGVLVDGPRCEGPQRPGQAAPLPLPCPAGLPDLAVVLGLRQQPGDSLPGVVGGQVGVRVRCVHDSASLLGQPNLTVDRSRRPVH